MSALSVFDPLPLRERLFVRARLWSAPLRLLAERAPVGRVADVGCGHGVLSALLAERGCDVVGIDPDERKIAWARASVGRRENARFEPLTVEALAAKEPHSFDAVLVADVLYLLPDAAWPSFLRACAKLLRPGAPLLLKEAEADGSWRYYKCLFQEEVMVKLLRRTQSSGGLGFLSRERMNELLHAASFRDVEIEAVARGYTTPHVLLTARAPYGG